MITVGTEIGILDGNQGMSISLTYNVPVRLDPLTLIPASDDKQLIVMCLLPPSSVLITIDGQRQAGAFVLRPNEHFDYKDERFVFKSATQVPITVASGRCKFCQTPLTVAAILWLAADSPLQGAKLCTACAKAFATSPR